MRIDTIKNKIVEIMNNDKNKSFTIKQLQNKDKRLKMSNYGSIYKQLEILIKNKIVCKSKNKVRYGRGRLVDAYKLVSQVNNEKIVSKSDKPILTRVVVNDTTTIRLTKTDLKELVKLIGNKNYIDFEVEIKQ